MPYFKTYMPHPDAPLAASFLLPDPADPPTGVSFFATLECELPDRHRFTSHAEVRIAVFQFIEGWCTPPRRHSALGHLSPAEFEDQRRDLVSAT